MGIGHFRVPPGPLFQNKGRCSAFYIEIIFHSHANKTHFHIKERLCTQPHFESGRFWNSEVAYSGNRFEKINTRMNFQ